MVKSLEVAEWRGGGRGEGIFLLSLKFDPTVAGGKDFRRFLWAEAEAREVPCRPKCVRPSVI